MAHGACAPGVPRGPPHTAVLGRLPRGMHLEQVVRSVANMTRAPAGERTAKKGSTDGRNDLVPHRRTGGPVRGQFRVRLRAGEVGRTLKGRTNHVESHESER